VTHKRITNENCQRTGADPKALRTVARLFESKGTPIGQMLSLFAQTLANLNKLGLKLSTGGILVRADRLTEVNEIFDDADD
jgi:tRNA A37 threonylcarbamoyladenosine synthetase subunit TsaC/SUA5/YrdC